jgi:hydroxymethylglutaryl-CoA synthase
MALRPPDIGILALEVFFPRNFTLQEDLENRDIEVLGDDKRSQIKGKYTKGLGQTALAFCTDLEDTVSNALNAISSLFAKYPNDESQFGRLEIGTESSVDRSKSIKTFLMQLFPTNRSLLGVGNVNACYGGTSALLNSVAWLESSHWDGRLALVICTDIAIYGDISARPTGGCGAVAIVVGPNAPIVIEPRVASYFCHSYDFYKPLGLSHPLVNGPLSLVQYFECLDGCYRQFEEDVDSFDFCCFYTPFVGQIRKATGRLAFLKDKRADDPEIPPSRGARTFMSELAASTTELFTQKVKPGCLLADQLGNG